MKKMVGCIAAGLMLWMVTGCGNKQNGSINSVADTTKSTLAGAAKEPEAAMLYCVKEKLTGEEKALLKKLKQENDAIIYYDEVNRYYAKKGDRHAVFSKLIIPQDSLSGGGYVYYNLTIVGDLPNIVYNYSEGSAASGDGSVVGEDVSRYYHTVVTYSTLGGDEDVSKNVEVYSNGVKLSVQGSGVDTTK